MSHQATSFPKDMSNVGPSDGTEKPSTKKPTAADTTAAARDMGTKAATSASKLSDGGQSPSSHVLSL